jgi:hypothetical protein
LWACRHRGRMPLADEAGDDHGAHDGSLKDW